MDYLEYKGYKGSVEYRKENVTKNSLRNLMAQKFGNFVHCTTKPIIGCLPFGTRMLIH